VWEKADDVTRYANTGSSGRLGSEGDIAPSGERGSVKVTLSERNGLNKERRSAARAIRAISSRGVAEMGPSSSGRERWEPRGTKTRST